MTIEVVCKDCQPPKVVVTTPEVAESHFVSAVISSEITQHLGETGHKTYYYTADKSDLEITIGYMGAIVSAWARPEK